MKQHLCDAGIWLALALSGHPYHGAATAWLDTVDAPAAVLFCRAAQQSFLRLLTTAAVLAVHGDPPLTNRAAWAAYEKLLADDRIVLRVEEPDGIDRHWKRFGVRGSASPKLWMDAYLAAFAVAGGHRLVTTDAAFKQFAGLDLMLLADARSG